MARKNNRQSQPQTNEIEQDPNMNEETENQQPEENEGAVETQGGVEISEEEVEEFANNLNSPENQQPEEMMREKGLEAGASLIDSSTESPLQPIEDVESSIEVEGIGEDNSGENTTATYEGPEDPAPEVEQPRVTETQPEVQTSEPEIPDPEPVDHFELVAAVFTDIVAKVKNDFGIEFTPEIFAFVVHGQNQLNSNQAIRVLDSLNVNQLYQLSLILGYEDRSVTAFEEWLMTFCTELGKLVGEKRGSRRGHRSSLSRDINEVIIKLERLEDMMTRMDDHRGTLEVRGLNRASYRGESERSMGSRSPRNRGLLETERD